MVVKRSKFKKIIVIKGRDRNIFNWTKMWICCFFRNDLWLSKLCYLSDTFAKLNDLNLSLQGKNCDIFTSNDKIESFIKKISIWKSRVEKNLFEMFSSVDNFVIEKIHRKTCIAKTIIDHLKTLEIQFRTYFILNIDLQKAVWIQKPFWVGLSEFDHLPLKAQEEFAELSCDSNLKLQFQKKPLIEFWIGTRT